MADPARYYIDPVLVLSADDQPTKASLHAERSPSGEWIKWNDFLDYKMAQRRNSSEETVTKLGMEIVELRSRLAELEQFSVLLDKPVEKKKGRK